MAFYSHEVRGILRFPRQVPLLLVRAQASQSSKPSVASDQASMSGSAKTDGAKKGGASVLPPSSTESDHTNPTATSSDSSTRSNKRPSIEDAKKLSFISTPVGQIGIIVVLATIIYYGYNTMTHDKIVPKDNDPYRKATADYQAANAKHTDVKL